VKSKFCSFSQQARKGFWAGRAGLWPLHNFYMIFCTHVKNQIWTLSNTLVNHPYCLSVMQLFTWMGWVLVHGSFGPVQKFGAVKDTYRDYPKICIPTWQRHTEYTPCWVSSSSICATILYCPNSNAQFTYIATTKVWLIVFAIAQIRYTHVMQFKMIIPFMQKLNNVCNSWSLSNFASSTF